MSRFGGLALAAGFLSAMFSGCGSKAAKSVPPAPPVVTVAPVEQSQVVEWEEFTGRTDAVESVEVRPRVSGHLQEVRFQSGQLVKRDDVLFVIDRRWYQAEFDRRQAEYEQARVRLENAERNARRAARLLASKAIASEAADATESQFQEARAALLAAKSSWESARLDLEFTEVRAPIDGRASRALMTVGNYVDGASSLLTTLVSVDPVYVYADVDENSLLKFNALANERKAAGDEKIPVELELADEKGFPHRGVIESFDNRLDPNTGTILLRAIFPNADGRLVPGLFARIRIPTSDRRPAFLVDETAIGTDQSQKFVLTLGEGNMVEYRQVKLGPAIGGKRIVREGLRAGEKVVVNGLQRARPGLPVSPEEQTASASDTSVKTARR
jgi:membrane fusion protein, multidrug efflux system